MQQYYGIILTTILVISVFILVASYQEYITNVIRNEENWEVKLKNIEFSKISEIENNKNIKEISILYNLGNTEETFYRYGNILTKVNFTAYSENAIKSSNIILKEGKFPTNSNEIVISSYLEEELYIGKNVEFTINGIKKEYTVVGIAEKLENDKVINAFNLVAGVLAYYEEETIPSQAKVDVYIITNDIREIYKTVEELVSNLELYSNNEEIEENIEYNKTLLNYSLVFDDNEEETSEMKMITEANSEEFSTDLIKIVGIILCIIVTISVILIYTTFSITYNERTKEIGILESIGMNRKQIKNMLIKENSILATIGIVIGELLGIGFMYFIIKIINILIRNQIKSPIGSKILIDPNIEIYLVITVGIILLTAVVIYIIVLLSSMLQMKKINKIYPINAINNNINNEKIQKVKKLRFIEKLFKQEGVLAVRNIKRNKTKYRAITASISITIILFLVISEMTNIIGGYIRNINNYKEFEIILANHSNDTSKEIINILEGTGIMDNYLKISRTIVNSSTINNNIIEPLSENKTNYSQIQVVTLEGQEYEKLLNNLEIKKLEKGKCILLDTVEVKNTGRVRTTKFAVGDNIILENIKNNEENLETSIEEQEMLNETQEIIGNIVKEDTKENEKVEEKRLEYELEIAAISQQDWGNITELNTSIYSPIILIVSEETFAELSKKLSFINDYIYIDTSKPEEIDNIVNNIKETGIALIAMNLYKENESYINRALMIRVLAYSFIIVVIMISAVNIFNIIYSNFILRIREFAILKSLGMSDKKIKKMLNLEGVFYGLKAILIGIIIGVIILYLIYLSTRESILETFKIPLIRIAIVIIVIYIIIFLAIYKGKKKIDINNIIEKVKKENI